MAADQKRNRIKQLEKELFDSIFSHRPTTLPESSLPNSYFDCRLYMNKFNFESLNFLEFNDYEKTLYWTDFGDSLDCETISFLLRVMSISNNAVECRAILKILSASNICVTLNDFLAVFANWGHLELNEDNLMIPASYVIRRPPDHCILSVIQLFSVSIQHFNVEDCKKMINEVSLMCRDPLVQHHVYDLSVLFCKLIKRIIPNENVDSIVELLDLESKPSEISSAICCVLLLTSGYQIPVTYCYLHSLILKRRAILDNISISDILLISNASKLVNLSAEYRETLPNLILYLMVKLKFDSNDSLGISLIIRSLAHVNQRYNNGYCNINMYSNYWGLILNDDSDYL